MIISWRQFFQNIGTPLTSTWWSDWNSPWNYLHCFSPIGLFSFLDSKIDFLSSCCYKCLLPPHLEASFISLTKSQILGMYKLLYDRHELSINIFIMAICAGYLIEREHLWNIQYLTFHTTWFRCNSTKMIRIKNASEHQKPSSSRVCLNENSNHV